MLKLWGMSVDSATLQMVCVLAASACLPAYYATQVPPHANHYAQLALLTHIVCSLHASTP